MKTTAGVWWAGVVALGLAVPAQAALQGRLPATAGGMDYQAYYDTVLDLTWVADANLAVTNTFGLATNANLGPYPGDPSGVVGFIDAGGVMTWPGARFWIDAMNAADYLGISNWRLPAALNPDGTGPCFGYDCTGSEMGYMYYTNLGNIAYPGAGWGLANTAPFANLQSNGYWSGTEYGPNPIFAWDFLFYYGDQSVDGKLSGFDAWAVRPGDVAVPEPASLGLVATTVGGLLGWGWRRRRR
jgi:hypothetical protein